MRMLIQGIKSLIRRPAKTLMLFIILFVVFNLIFTGFIIQNSIKQSKEYIRNQLGSVVEYRMDFEKFMSSMQNQRQKANNNQAQMARPGALSISVAEKIANSPYVKSFYITDSANVNSDTIDPAETQQSGGNFQRNFSDFTLSGTNQPENLDFVLGNVKLTDGGILTQNNIDNSDKVVIISKDIAETNSLKVGDAISLSRVAMNRMREGGNDSNNNNQSNNNSNSTTASAAEDYDVIGIYEAVDDTFSVNTIFTSNNVIAALNGTEASDDTNASIVFLLDSPSHIDAFKSEQSRYLTSEYHILYSNDEEYESLTKPLNLISFIASILIWVVFIAGAAIILAIVTIFVRDRKFEIGLLLSSGESKLKIVSQFVFEMLVIAIIAFVISVGSSNIASQSVSTWIVDNQLLSQTSLIGSTNTSVSTGFRGGGMGFRMRGINSTSLYGSVDMENVANQFNVSVSTAILFKLLLASMVLVLIGSTIPLSVIMGYKPKRILQDS